MFWVGHSKATVRYSSIHNEDTEGGLFVSSSFRGRSSKMERRSIPKPTHSWSVLQGAPSVSPLSMSTSFPLVLLYYDFALNLLQNL